MTLDATIETISLQAHNIQLECSSHSHQAAPFPFPISIPIPVPVPIPLPSPSPNTLEIIRTWCTRICQKFQCRMWTMEHGAWTVDHGPWFWQCSFIWNGCNSVCVECSPFSNTHLKSRSSAKVIFTSYYLSIFSHWANNNGNTATLDSGVRVQHHPAPPYTTTASPSFAYAPICTMPIWMFGSFCGHSLLAPFVCWCIVIIIHPSAEPLHSIPCICMQHIYVYMHLDIFPLSAINVSHYPLFHLIFRIFPAHLVKCTCRSFLFDALSPFRFVIYG